MMSENLHAKDCLRTVSGRYINLLDPDPLSITPMDIAVGLSRQCRFGGHTKKFYSVAEHSDWCRHQCHLRYPDDEHLQFAVFMHDAHEFLLGDIPSPLKALIPAYATIADKLQDAINKRFGIQVGPWEWSVIKEIDREALEWEWNNKVLKFSGWAWNEKDTADMFIDNFKRLCRVPHVL